MTRACDDLDLAPACLRARLARCTVQAPGLGAPPRRRRSEIRHLARGACAAAAAAQVRSAGAAESRTRRSAASTSPRPARPSGCTCRPGRSSSRRATARISVARARALFAAGFRPGDIVHNSFSYHLTPGAYILEAGAHALGCAVIPGGIGNTEQQLERSRIYRPSGYHRHAGLHQDPARHRGQGRQGRILDQARPRLRRGAAGVAPRRSSPPAASRCCSATPSPRSA